MAQWRQKGLGGRGRQQEGFLRGWMQVVGECGGVFIQYRLSNCVERAPALKCRFLFYIMFVSTKAFPDNRHCPRYALQVCPFRIDTAEETAFFTVATAVFPADQESSR